MEMDNYWLCKAYMTDLGHTLQSGGGKIRASQEGGQQRIAHIHYTKAPMRASLGPERL